MQRMFRCLTNLERLFYFFLFSFSFQNIPKKLVHCLYVSYFTISFSFLELSRCLKLSGKSCLKKRHVSRRAIPSRQNKQQQNKTRRDANDCIKYAWVSSVWSRHIKYAYQIRYQRGKKWSWRLPMHNSWRQRRCQTRIDIAFVSIQQGVLNICICLHILYYLIVSDIY